VLEKMRGACGNNMAITKATVSTTVAPSYGDDTGS